MNFEEFTEEIVKQIKKKLGSEYKIRCETVTKNNSTNLTALAICKHGEVIIPTIYMEDFFEQYDQGETIYQIVHKIISIYQNACKKIERQNPLSFSMELDNCKDRIVYRLVSKEKNLPMLKDVPHELFLDLAIIFTVVYRHTKEGLETIRITNEIMEKWSLTTSELMEYAKKNTRCWFPEKISNLAEIVFPFLEGENEFDLEEESPINHMKVLTNTSKINGASVILYDHVIENLAEKFKSDIYILPSSIHELLILPSNGSDKFEELKETVQQVNKVAVSKEEYLSDTVYLYHKDTKSFEYK